MESNFTSEDGVFDGVGIPAFTTIQDYVYYDARTRHTNADFFEAVSETRSAAGGHRDGGVRLSGRDAGREDPQASCRRSGAAVSGHRSRRPRCSNRARCGSGARPLISLSDRPWSDSFLSFC